VRRQYAFKTFIDAMTFVNRIALEAVAADHNPDILTTSKRVTLAYSTHSQCGLTVKDFEGAAMADRLEPREPRRRPEVTED
jgi:4a-hydroxytetrahydrobiopterin dehydratase